jgi:hypothetical protein
LLIVSVEDGSLLNPNNIQVGVTSDLIIEVQCMAEDGSGAEVFTWSENGTAVPSGLQVFGVSQGGNGVLRVSPVSQELRNVFVCSDDSGNSLNVTFTSGKEGW